MSPAAEPEAAEAEASAPADPPPTPAAATPPAPAPTPDPVPASDRLYDDIPADFWENGAAPEGPPPPPPAAPPELRSVPPATSASASADAASEPHNGLAALTAHPNFSELQALFPGEILEFQEAKRTAEDASNATDETEDDAVELDANRDDDDS